MNIPVATWRQDLRSAGVREIPVGSEAGILAATLSDFHGDPADRILVATAILHQALLATADRQILAGPGGLERVDAGQ